jgi:hypothetical protein
MATKVSLGPVEIRLPPRVALVEDRGPVGEHERGAGPLTDTGDDPVEVVHVAVDPHLATPVLHGSFQVVQAAIQVDNVGLLAEDPLVEVGEDVRAVAAVLGRTHDDGLAREPRSHGGV